MTPDRTRIFDLAADIYAERHGDRPVAVLLYHAVEGLAEATETVDGAAAIAERITDVRAEVLLCRGEGMEEPVSEETFRYIAVVREAIRRLRVPLN